MENFNERTKLAIDLAKIAGNEIKRILHDEDIHTKGKGLNDVVTIADIKNEKIIVDKISEVFSEDTIISEEAGGKCSSLNKEILDYSKIDKQIIIATNGQIHNDFENIINLDQ